MDAAAANAREFIWKCAFVVNFREGQILPKFSGNPVNCNMSSPQKAQVKLLYDIISPYSYSAFATLLRYKEAWNLDVDLCPISLGGVLRYTENTPPLLRLMEVPYIVSQVSVTMVHIVRGATRCSQPLSMQIMDHGRISDRSSVDIRSPPGHPMRADLVRFLRAVREEEGQEILAECTRLIFEEFYAVQTDYRTEQFWECLVPTLTKENLARIRQLSQTTRHKEGIKEDVKNAVENYGMFGAPWMVVTRASDRKVDVFFGADKFDAMAWWLGPEYVWRGHIPMDRILILLPPSGTLPIIEIIEYSLLFYGTRWHAASATVELEEGRWCEKAYTSRIIQYGSLVRRHQCWCVRLPAGAEGGLVLPPKFLLPQYFRHILLAPEPWEKSFLPAVQL
ncbi:hypothetical protein BS47DRAFT_1381593 [Hydnum rufescens UP504]|uniref:DSBA-like thioredoxin domain-containing protein n=1 Tax=Hydnum rufescens UP504 TaxID=1448309 RepID=A0A9P6B078_9AGAM|nr:hypothetical protein BS47DRAFT_1381593 [Hydnum rufescens UP504]